MALRMLPLVLALLAATACADDGADTATEVSSVPPTASATAGDATDSTPPELPVKPPRMADEPPPRRMPGSDATLDNCNPDEARGAIGKEATAEVVEQARIAAGADVVRTLKPGQVITMEYHASRLNLSVDDNNVVVDVSCG